MTVVLPPGRPGVPPEQTNHKQALRDHAAKLNAINSGHFNCTLIVTLGTSVASTTVKDARISKLNTSVLLCPTTADAAKEAASGNMYSVITDGQVVINHANTATADRTFQMVMIG